MPARGGAFFGFAIVVAVALVTWGIIALVEVADDDNNDSNDSYDSNDIYDSNDSEDLSAADREADSDIQEMLNNAEPGDIIYIPEGTHYISLTTAVDGTEDAPITIRNEEGVSREDCVLVGDDRTRVLEILHNHYIIEGFTIDGDDSSGVYKEQLIVVEGSRDYEEDEDGVLTSITGVHIQGMALRNAGKECIRLRYFATNSVVQYNEIGPCGIEDFQQDSDGSNGEGVYIGTALEMIGVSAGDDVVDVCTGIFVMFNDINTQGSEGVDIKEGSYGNVVFQNTIQGQMAPEAGGISLRGDSNYVTQNHIIDGEGTCVRIGGSSYDDTDYGINNEVYNNNLDGCRYSAIKVNESPQIICGNTVTPSSDPTDDELYAEVRGDVADEYTTTVAAECTEEVTVVDLPEIYDGTDGTDGTDYVTGEDDDPVVENDDGVVADNDDGQDDGQDVFDDDTSITNGYKYKGCYNDNEQNPLLDVETSADDTDLSVEKCVALCVAEANAFAGIKEGSDCWCGDNEDYTVYGEGFCNFECTGSGETACGGEDAFSLYEIFGDGGVTATDYDNDDGGVVGSAGTNTSASSDAPTASPSSVVVVQDGDDDVGETATESPITTDEDGVIVTSGTYLGCFRDSDADPILVFEYTDEDALTPASCIEHCRANGDELAGVQEGSQCYCGTTDDYERYGTTTCNFTCTGDSEQTCGGDGAVGIWTVD